MYKTKSIDTAAYIYSQGHECKIRPLNDSHAEFTFPSKDAERLAKKYLSGKVIMSLHKYQHSRLQLKILGSKETAVKRLKREQSTAKHRRASKPFALATGSNYYYKENGEVKQATWQGSAIDSARLKMENVYRKAEEIKL